MFPLYYSYYWQFLQKKNALKWLVEGMIDCALEKYERMALKELYFIAIAN